MIFDKEYIEYLLSKTWMVKADSRSSGGISIGILRFLFSSRDVAVSALFYFLYKIRKEDILISIEMRTISDLYIKFEVKDKNISVETTVTRFDLNSINSFFSNVPYDDKNVFVSFGYLHTNSTEEFIKLDDEVGSDVIGIESPLKVIGYNYLPL